MKMELYESIVTRRSVRGFTNEVVPEAVLEKIVKAGQCAPSGMNRQPFHFIVVSKKGTRDRLSKYNADIMGIDGDPFYGAPGVIVVLADTNAPTYMYDGALAMGQMLMAAHALGYSARWIHRAKEVFENHVELRKEFGIEDSYQGIGFCVIGKPSVEPTDKPITSKVTWVK